MTVRPLDAKQWTVVAPLDDRGLRDLRAALDGVVAPVQGFLASRLRGNPHRRWDVTVLLTCGAFSFGHSPLAHTSARADFPENDPIYELYRWWNERAGDDVHAAIEAIQELIEYWLGFAPRG